MEKKKSVVRELCEEKERGNEVQRVERFVTL